MVRAGASTPSTSKRKEKEGAAAVSAESKAEEAEGKRLRDFAFSRRLLSRTRSHALQPSLPSKTILNSDGRDIVKKGHRKSKYLFAFPGLMAPVAGGKLGELTNLDSKNPVLYVEFPQGRLKLFGTIVYPKNKYLTLHFPRGSGNIVCEDCFESLIVFSQAWWIGTKEHNPEEARLQLPRNLEQVKCADVDFTAGAGQAKNYNNTTGHQLERSEVVAQFALKPKPDLSEAESSDKDTEDQIISQPEDQITSQPVRQSARTAGRTLKYADSSSDKEDDSDSAESQQILNVRRKKQLQAPKELPSKEDKHIGSTTVIVVSDCDTPIKNEGTGTIGKRSPSDVKSPATMDSRNIAAASKTSLKASTNSKTSVLKQSRLDAFCHQDPAPEEGRTDAPSMDLQHEVTRSAIKTTKRPRKASKEDSEGSRLDEDDNSSGIKNTPSKDRKRVKREKEAGSKASTPTASHSKTSNGGRAKQGKSGNEKKSATVNASKGVGSASKGKKPTSRSTKSSKRSFDTEDEMSDPGDASDDSDEDWVG